MATLVDGAMPDSVGATEPIVTSLEPRSGMPAPSRTDQGTAIRLPTTSAERIAAMQVLFSGLAFGREANDWFVLRFVTQLDWFERHARQQYAFYVVTRLIAILAGITTPALFASPDTQIGPVTVHGLAFVTGLSVAAAVAVDGFLRFGEHWRHFRTIAEMMKIEFSSLVAMAPPYDDHRSRDRLFAEFVERCERLFRDDIRRYMASVAPSPQTGDSKGTTG